MECDYPNNQQIMIEQMQKDLAGRYHVLEFLGSGGFSTVWKAFDEKLQQEVAIKHFYNKNLRAGNFYKEIMITFQLQHQNIVNMLNLQETSQYSRYLILEYCSGGNLRGCIDAERNLANEKILEIIQQINSGLLFAHSKGIVHRDLKPENVLLLKKNSLDIKIADFGMAKLAAQQNHGEFDSISGSPLYMAPEQFVGKYSNVSDMYALGVILYELIFGVPPFVGTPEELAQQHLYKSPNLDNAPGIFFNLLQGLLCKDQKQRFTALECQNLIKILTSNIYNTKNNVQKRVLISLKNASEIQFQDKENRLSFHKNNNLVEGIAYLYGELFYIQEQQFESLGKRHFKFYNYPYPSIWEFLPEHTIFYPDWQHLVRNHGTIIPRSFSSQLFIPGEDNCSWVFGEGLEIKKIRYQQKTFSTAWSIQTKKQMVKAVGLLLDENCVVISDGSSCSLLYVIKEGKIQNTIQLPGICWDLQHWPQPNCVCARVLSNKNYQFIVCVIDLQNDHLSLLANSQGTVHIVPNYEQQTILGLKNNGEVVVWNVSQLAKILYPQNVNSTKYLTLGAWDDMWALTYQNPEGYHINIFY